MMTVLIFTGCVYLAASVVVGIWELSGRIKQNRPASRSRFGAGWRKRHDNRRPVIRSI